ncbi:sensor protein GacS [Capsaspora owczarzaki ATCC 30864]|uniref:Sensor protein GacS n=1 Tax=Capsaspora owczarzaki (strain ATCC 30864) TaxID=595528 RepID=A0A0D2VV71_CAPO3|nr:sensor protein GacS [Capsaspora owczarzaki ATCC 30864]KJE95352.1 sensor protein GacS [Capsaspora owczarzaki ATCC 30864]|eukprot:XP_004345397.2 sensor protein GacS [Capsaspora owczarzaki ATCC 30864]
MMEGRSEPSSSKQTAAMLSRHSTPALRVVLADAGADDDSAAAAAGAGGAAGSPTHAFGAFAWQQQQQQQPAAAQHSSNSNSSTRSPTMAATGSASRSGNGGNTTASRGRRRRAASDREGAPTTLLPQLNSSHGTGATTGTRARHNTNTALGNGNGGGDVMVVLPGSASSEGSRSDLLFAQYLARQPASDQPPPLLQASSPAVFAQQHSARSLVLAGKSSALNNPGNSGDPNQGNSKLNLAPNTAGPALAAPAAGLTAPAGSFSFQMETDTSTAMNSTSNTVSPSYSYNTGSPLSPGQALRGSASHSNYHAVTALPIAVAALPPRVIYSAPLDANPLPQDSAAHSASVASTEPLIAGPSRTNAAGRQPKSPDSSTFLSQSDSLQHDDQSQRLHQRRPNRSHSFSGSESEDTATSQSTLSDVDSRSDSMDDSDDDDDGDSDDCSTYGSRSSSDRGADSDADHSFSQTDQFELRNRRTDDETDGEGDRRRRRRRRSNNRRRRRLRQQTKRSWSKTCCSVLSRPYRRFRRILRRWNRAHQSEEVGKPFLMHPVHLNFADPAAESEYSDHICRRQLPLWRTSAFVVSIIMFAFAFFDWFNIDETHLLAAALVIRAFSISYLLFFATYLSKTAFFERHYSAIVTQLLIVLGVSFVIVRQLNDPSSPVVALLVLIVYAYIWCVVRLRIMYSTLCTAAVLVAFNAGHYAQETGSNVTENVYLFCALLIFAFQGYLNERLHRHDFCLRSATADAALAVAIARKYEQSDQLKTQFFENMAHDMRTPVNAIVGIAQLLTESCSDREQLDFIRLIADTGLELRVLIDDLLDMSTIQAGKLTLRPEPMYLTELVEKSLDTLAVAFHRKNLELFSFVEHETYQLMVDGGRLKQIIFNFLSNSCKFTSTGGASLTVARLIEDEGTVTYQFCIADSGIGIKTSDQQKLFRRFFQIDNEVQKKVTGTGLGLAVCKQLIQHMDGSLLVDSHEGQGTTIVFAIPFKKATANPPFLELPDMTQQQQQQQEQQQPSLVQLKQTEPAGLSASTTSSQAEFARTQLARESAPLATKSVPAAFFPFPEPFSEGDSNSSNHHGGVALGGTRSRASISHSASDIGTVTVQFTSPTKNAQSLLDHEPVPERLPLLLEYDPLSQMVQKAPLSSSTLACVPELDHGAGVDHQQQHPILTHRDSKLTLDMAQAAPQLPQAAPVDTSRSSAGAAFALPPSASNLDFSCSHFTATGVACQYSLAGCHERYVRYCSTDRSTQCVIVESTGMFARCLMLTLHDLGFPNVISFPTTTAAYQYVVELAQSSQTKILVFVSDHLEQQGAGSSGAKHRESRERERERESKDSQTRDTKDRPKVIWPSMFDPNRRRGSRVSTHDPELGMSDASSTSIGGVSTHSSVSSATAPASGLVAPAPSSRATLAIPTTTAGISRNREKSVRRGATIDTPAAFIYDLPPQPPKAPAVLSRHTSADLYVTAASSLEVASHEWRGSRSRSPSPKPALRRTSNLDMQEARDTRDTRDMRDTRDSRDTRDTRGRVDASIGSARTSSSASISSRASMPAGCNSFLEALRASPDLWARVRCMILVCHRPQGAATHSLNKASTDSGPPSRRMTGTMTLKERAQIKPTKSAMVFPQVQPHASRGSQDASSHRPLETDLPSYCAVLRTPVRRSALVEALHKLMWEAKHSAVVSWRRSTVMEHQPVLHASATRVQTSPGSVSRSPASKSSLVRQTNVPAQRAPLSSVAWHDDLAASDEYFAATTASAAAATPQSQTALGSTAGSSATSHSPVPPVAASNGFVQNESMITAFTLPTDSPARPLVLVAEDNPLNTRVLSALLSRMQVDCDFVSNGMEVVDQFKDNAQRWMRGEDRRFAFVLMDIEMPVLDGYAATAKLRAYEQENGLPHVPVYGASAHSAVREAPRALANGMDGFYCKPLLKADIQQLIASWQQSKANRSFSSTSFAFP